jgi:hypothetical protein
VADLVVLYKTPKDPAAFDSPEGKATAADVPKFASGGVEMHFSEAAEV